MDSGNKFVKADSRNLPEVSTIMILEFVQSSNKYSIDEIRDVKRLAPSQEHYIMDAIGFVKLKKDATKCIVKAKVAEEEVEMKYYVVSVHVDEQENTITDSTCNCQPEFAGGCKHTLTFLLWLENKSSIPERAPVQSFWHKPLLGTGYPLLAKDIFKFKSRRSAMNLQPRNPAVLEDFVRECKERNIENLLTLNYSPSQ